MLASVGVLLCFSFLSYIIVSAKKAPFIDPCKWDDRACLKSSTQKAFPFFADGLPDLGVRRLDPINLGTIIMNEADSKTILKDVTLAGTRNCQVLDVERNIVEKWLIVKTKCPIEIRGHYTTSGLSSSVPIEGDGPFYIKTDKVRFTVKAYIDTVEGKDGDKYWQFLNTEHILSVEKKPLLQFDNLFNGDEKKATRVQKIMDKNWKELSQQIGKYVIDAFVKSVNKELKKFMEIVPGSELEL